MNEQSSISSLKYYNKSLANKKEILCVTIFGEEQKFVAMIFVLLPFTNKSKFSVKSDEFVNLCHFDVHS